MKVKHALDESGHGVPTGYSEVTMADSSDTETSSSSSASSGDFEHLQEDKGLVPYDFEPYESETEDTAVVESLTLTGESSDEDDGRLSNTEWHVHFSNTIYRICYFLTVYGMLL